MTSQTHHRTQRISTAATALAMLLCLASPNVSRAWMSSKPPTGPKSTAPKIQIQPVEAPSGSSTAKFYQTTSRMIAEDAAQQALAGSATTSSTPTTNDAHTPSRPTTLSQARQLPWMQRKDGPDSAPEDNDFLDHWNWQFSYFEEHLTNLRVRDRSDEADEVRDLYYAVKTSEPAASDEPTKEATCQRVYTVSLASDEYHDIRMTYMHCPGMQTFRCLAYPRHGDLPVQGMAAMTMAGGSRHLAILDYHPLPPTDDREARINDSYTSELLKLRQEIPSFSQEMTRKHYKNQEERKYYTEFPLLGRCNTAEEDPAEYRKDLRTAQTRYVAKHVELTQQFGTKQSCKTKHAAKFASSYVLERHADFDTHVSEKEPSGPILRGIFGIETGDKLVNEVIYPLSKHGQGSSSSS